MMIVLLFDYIWAQRQGLLLQTIKYLLRRNTCCQWFSSKWRTDLTSRDDTPKSIWLRKLDWIGALRPLLYGSYLAGDIFKSIFSRENCGMWYANFERVGFNGHSNWNCVAQKRQQAGKGHQQAQCWIQSHTNYFVFENSKTIDTFAQFLGSVMSLQKVDKTSWNFTECRMLM